MAQFTDVFEDLSHALRVLLEADYRANREGLLQIDRAEAVGNIENALGGALNAFHSLFDAMEKAAHPGRPDWYAVPQLATVLVLRNARHHNLANKIRTMYSYYAQEAEKVGRMEMYVLVDFPAGEEGGDTFDVYLSWADLRVLLALPEKLSRIRLQTSKAIAQYLSVDKFALYAARYQLSESRVFLNVVPLLVNAAVTLIPFLKPHVTPRSTESESFMLTFDGMPLADTSDHEVACGPIAYPE